MWVLQRMRVGCRSPGFYKSTLNRVILLFRQWAAVNTCKVRNIKAILPYISILNISSFPPKLSLFWCPHYKECHHNSCCLLIQKYMQHLWHCIFLFHLCAPFVYKWLIKCLPSHQFISSCISIILGQVAIISYLKYGGQGLSHLLICTGFPTSWGLHQSQS